MDKVIVAVVTSLLFSIFETGAQDTRIDRELKGNSNHTVFLDRLNIENLSGIDSSYKSGLYLGESVSLTFFLKSGRSCHFQAPDFNRNSLRFKKN